ncbi:MAG TPA: DNA-binding response regulator [Opitutae bacterium]|nr:DNA-binding response regulator [Puniceicoccaceae bacterium]HBR95183.1 DNA-binding response regulator [Opitutae bacterium]|tara:strand:- start:237 stop:866 length:630 start_codon:yes stop_codon:yes gene_type:complete
MKSCLIIEDKADCQRWLHQIVSEAFPNCEIALAGDQASARIHIAETSFELAIIDLALPDGCGLETVRALKRIAPETKSVIMTAIGEDAKIVAALSAGAQGYLLKDYPAEQLIRQLRELSHGVPALSPAIARRIMEHFQHTGPIQSEDTPLTKRERETLTLISRGYRNNEVAEQLGIAPTTVASHIKAIYRKLGISTRAEASWYATRLGL